MPTLPKVGQRLPILRLQLDDAPLGDSLIAQGAFSELTLTPVKRRSRKTRDGTAAAVGGPNGCYGSNSGSRGHS
jgi:hypothetical protein